MKRYLALTSALALCLTLSACGSAAPSLDEVEKAIRDGSVTVQDALDKGWVTQDWADDYLEENTVPAADKVAYNAVGEFETSTLAGGTYTRDDLPSTTFLVFLDPQAPEAEDFYSQLTAAADGVRSAGAEIVVCSKGGLEAELFQGAPFSVIDYNEAMQGALAQNHEMASGSPCIGVWYVNGSLLSAWSSQVDAAGLADSAAAFVAMGQPQDTPEDRGDSVAILPMA